MAEAPAVRKCPRCGATPKAYREIWAGSCIVFEAGRDGRPKEKGIEILDDASPEYVIAECGCGHDWRLRGVMQITELRADTD